MKTLLLIFLFIFCLTAKAQSITVGNKTFLADKSKACNPNLIFTMAEKPVKFDSTNGKLLQRMSSSIVLDKSISGEVRLWFMINCKGEAYGFQVLNGISEEIDNRIIDELLKMQGWIAGNQNGKPIDMVNILKLAIKKGVFKNK